MNWKPGALTGWYLARWKNACRNWLTAVRSTPRWPSESDRAAPNRGQKKARVRGCGLKVSAEQRTIQRNSEFGSAIECAGLHLLRQRLRRWQRDKRPADGLAVVHQVPTCQQAALAELRGDCAADYRHDLNLGHKCLHQSMGLL